MKPGPVTAVNVLVLERGQEITSANAVSTLSKDATCCEVDPKCGKAFLPLIKGKIKNSVGAIVNHQKFLFPILIPQYTNIQEPNRPTEIRNRADIGLTILIKKFS